MAKNVTITWELPTTRTGGAALPTNEIQHTLVELSADGGANFGTYATVISNEPQSLTIPELDVGQWAVRFTVQDTLGQNSAPHTELFEVVDDSPPGTVINVVITLA